MSEPLRQPALRRAVRPNHYGMAPCWEQPGKQEWHLACALQHPARFLRSRGPRRWRYGGPDMHVPAGSMPSVAERSECMRCGSDEWTDVDYSGCSVCREPAEQDDLERRVQS